MPLSSLPSNYGIGDFGKEAYIFADKMKDAGLSVWQVLPLNPLGLGNSPYQTISSKAIDEIYVSPEPLFEAGLIESLPKNIKGDKIDFDTVRKMKRELLIQAYEHFIPDEKYAEFVQESWVKEYAEFVTLKEQYPGKSWTEWDKEEIEKFKKSDRYALLYELHAFIQYVVFEQFNKWKEYLHELEIELVGDLPFYVGLDSTDVYFHQENFLLDEDGRPEWIAGVPPDYFSETGQRWGNPIYDWDHLKDDHFAFWFDRLNYLSHLYDRIRIDHFRAFDTYWKIPASCPTAIDGEWIENCGDLFFEELFEKYPNMKIIAEDLGDIRDEVRTLRDKYQLPGMRVLQFDYKSHFKENEVLYIGTHDNASLQMWYDSLNNRERTNFRNYLKRRYPKLEWFEACLYFALDQKDELVILSITDIMHTVARINTPGTVSEDNWSFKLKTRNYGNDMHKMRKYIKATNRLQK